jgi:hypothetical protein
MLSSFEIEGVLKVKFKHKDIKLKRNSPQITQMNTD